MAEGYYAVGLAMRMPNASVHAFDTNEEAHAFCREVAKLNNVPERVKVGGLFNGEDFARHPAGTLVFCDIEGAEDALLDPDKYPALRKMDLIVELHECFQPDIARKVCARFAASQTSRWCRITAATLSCRSCFRRLATSINCSRSGNGGPAPHHGP